MMAAPAARTSGNDMIVVRIAAHRREKRQLDDDSRHGEKIFDIADDLFIRVAILLAEPRLVPEYPDSLLKDAKGEAKIIMASDTGTNDRGWKTVWL